METPPAAGAPASARPARSPLALGLVGKAAEAIPLLLLVTAVPRMLGPANYGRVAVAAALVSIGSASASLGGPVMLARFIPTVETAERTSLARALAGRMARWRASQTAVIAVVAVTLSTLMPGRFPPLLTLLVVGALCLDVGATLCFQVGLGLGHDRAWAFRYAFQNSVLVVGVLLLAALGEPRAAAAGVTGASGAAFLVGAALVVPQLLHAGRDAAIPPGALRFGALQAVAGLFLQVILRGGIVSVALLAGSSAQTGFAGLAVGIGLAGTLAVWQAFAIQLPRVSDLAGRDSENAERATERLAWHSLLLVAPMMLLATPIVMRCLPLLAGSRFHEARSALGPALAVIPLAPLSGLANQAAALRLRAGARAWTTALGAAVSTAVAVATVPFFGAVGATTALFVGTLASAFAAAVALRASVSRRVAWLSIAASTVTLGLGVLVSRTPRSWGLVETGVAAVILASSLVAAGTWFSHARSPLFRRSAREADGSST